MNSSVHNPTVGSKSLSWWIYSHKISNPLPAMHATAGCFAHVLARHMTQRLCVSVTGSSEAIARTACLGLLISITDR